MQNVALLRSFRRGIHSSTRLRPPARPSQSRLVISTRRSLLPPTNFIRYNQSLSDSGGDVSTIQSPGREEATPTVEKSPIPKPNSVLTNKELSDSTPDALALEGPETARIRFIGTQLPDRISGSQLRVWDTKRFDMPRGHPKGGKDKGESTVDDPVLPTIPRYLMQLRNREVEYYDPSPLPSMSHRKLPAIFPLIRPDEIVRPGTKGQNRNHFKMRGFLAQESRLPKHILSKILRHLTEAVKLYGPEGYPGSENLPQTLVSTITDPIAHLFGGTIQKVPRKIPAPPAEYQQQQTPAQEFQDIGILRRTQDLYMMNGSATLVCISTASNDENGVSIPLTRNAAVAQVVAELVSMDFFNERHTRRVLPVIGCLFHKNSFTIVVFDPVADQILSSDHTNVHWYPNPNGTDYHGIRLVQRISNLIFDVMLESFLNSVEATLNQTLKAKVSTNNHQAWNAAAQVTRKALAQARAAAVTAKDDKLHANKLTWVAIEALKEATSIIPTERFNTHMDVFLHEPWNKGFV